MGVYVPAHGCARWAAGSPPGRGRGTMQDTPHLRVAHVLAAMLVVTATLGWPGSSSGQEARGTVTGTVRDASGGVVPGATVTITNEAMGTNVSVVTNDRGFFQAPYLLPGTYQLVAELSGFKRYVREALQVRVSDTLDLEVVLEIGQPEEEVTVTASTPLLETTSASLGQVVDTRRVAELPTPHGDPFALIGVAGGVSSMGALRLDRPFEPTHIVGYAMAGTRSNRSDITIDGVPSTSTANAGEVIASYVPPQDLVQEFKVQTATFDAQFGNTEGGVTNLSLKSGTNELHGTGYFVKMPADLFANDFFANANDIPLPDFSYNRWGATAGGPILRQKTFFMYGYEGIDEARPRNNGNPTVPTEKMRNGDFSELLALGPEYQIYNPYTRRAIGGGRFEQERFTGNIIPQELIDPAAQEILEFYALPRTAGSPDGTNNFQRPELKENTAYGTHTIRIDHVATDKQRMYGRVSWYDRDSDYNNYFDTLATGQEFGFASRQVALDHVYAFNGTTVLNVRYGYDRFIRSSDSNSANHGFDLTALGMPAAYNDAISEDIRRFPRVDIEGYQGTGIGGFHRPTETQSFIATLNRSAGAHALKTGLEFRRYRETQTFFGNDNTGQFNFDSTWTRGPFDNSPPSPGELGQSFAGFLLGLPTDGWVNRSASYDERSQTWGFFVQDDWRISSRLTLNLGLRYELETPLVEVDNRTVRGFDADAVQPIEQAARAAYAGNPTSEIPPGQFMVRGGLTFPGVDGLSSGLYETPKNNIMPRLGFAYQLDDKTVLRGGYGMFYGFLGQRRGDVSQSGFSERTNLVPTRDSGLTFIETLSNPFQNGIQEPVGAARGIETFVGQSITFFDPEPDSPRMQRWQVGIQRELPGRWVAEVTYVGNHGSRLQTNRNLNATPLEHLSTRPVRDEATIDYLSEQVPNPFFGLMPSTAISALSGEMIARERLLRPFPQFDEVNTTTNEGSSWYHALQVDLQRRFAGGYTLGGNYTFSRFTETLDFLNGADPAPSEFIGIHDVPHRVTLNGIWELPFGEGRRFAARAHPIVSTLIGGWQISGIYTYQMGRPIQNWGNLIFNGNPRDIALPGSERTVERWFNTEAGFERRSDQQLGSNVRTFPMRFDFLRTPPINNVDLSIIKNTRVGFGNTLQFRLEALNALNHPLFNSPNINPAAEAFGSTVGSTQGNYSRRVQVMVKFLF
ncbi:MAG: hypothetical protein GEU99_17345 [Luteitalea sp.]|nr:hypothetical protein [Luteitalea sp.]